MVAGVPITAFHNGQCWLIRAGTHSRQVHGIKAKAGAGLLTVELSKRPMFKGESRLRAWIDAHWTSVFTLRGVQAYLSAMTGQERLEVARRELS